MLGLHRPVMMAASLILLQVGMTASTAQQPTPAEEEVLKISRAWLDARNRRDLGAYASFMADDLIGSTDAGELVTKAWLVDFLSKHPPEDEKRTDLRDVQVHLDGDTAIVNYLITSLKGWGRAVVISNRRRTEVFKKRNDKWLAIAIHESDVPANYFKEGEVDPKTLKDYVGHYDWPRHKVDDIETFTIEDGHLFSEWRGTKGKWLAKEKEKDTFFQRDDDGWLTFMRDQTGHVTGFIYYYPVGQEVPVTKID